MSWTARIDVEIILGTDHRSCWSVSFFMDAFSVWGFGGVWGVGRFGEFGWFGEGREGGGEGEGLGGVGGREGG